MPHCLFNTVAKEDGKQAATTYSPTPEGDDPKVPAARQALSYRLVGKGKTASIMAWAARILSLCVPIGRPVGVACAYARGYGERTGFSGGLRLD